MMNYQVQQQHKQTQPSYSQQQRALNNDSHGQSFYERNLMFQQQQMNLKHRDYNNMSLSSGTNSSTSSSFEASIQQPRQYDLLAPFYNLYEPPKPDTPPSSVLPPFWWDPVWGCSPNEVKRQPSPESVSYFFSFWSQH